MLSFNSVYFVALLAATFPARSMAQGWFGGFGGFPSCATSCWDSSCSWTDGGSCFCTNATLVDSVNSCVASSTCADSDKEGVYQKIAQLCAAAGHQVTAAPEATFSATSNSAWPTTYTGSNGPWGARFGPFGGGWGPWGSSGSWTSGAWTNWWDGPGCPGSTWTGWTSGDWDSKAPWTSWTACSATTTATVTFTTTTTSDGSTSIFTGTTFGVKVAEGSTTASTPSATATPATTTGSSGSSGTKDAGPVSWTLIFGGVAASFFGAMVVL